MVETAITDEDGLFDQRHLIALHQRGLINELPLELGPMPLTDFGRGVDDDLRRWNIIDDAGNLTSAAEEQLRGLTSYEWAMWGILLLYNERREVEADLPEEFFQYGVQYALRDIPRVTFLIGYRGNTLTTATVAGGRLAIAHDRVRGGAPADRYASAGSVISNLLDPKKHWQPYPMEEVSVPAATANSIKRFRSDDPDEVAETTVEGLKEAGMTRTAVRSLRELATADNVALAQVTLTVRTAQGKKTAKNNALGVGFFLGKKAGVVVSYPTRGLDGRQWITYQPATSSAMARAVAALHEGLATSPPDDIELN